MKKIVLIIFLLLGYLGARNVIGGGPMLINTQPLSGTVLTGMNNDSGNQIIATLTNTTIDIKGDFWLTMMTIWCTLFAVFFVYEGFRIEKVSAEISNKHETFMKQYEIELENASFYSQINFGLMRFNINQFQKGIDYLADMIKLTRDKDKIYTLSLFIGRGYYNR